MAIAATVPSRSRPRRAGHDVVAQRGTARRKSGQPRGRPRAGRPRRRAEPRARRRASAETRARVGHRDLRERRHEGVRRIGGGDAQCGRRSPARARPRRPTARSTGAHATRLPGPSPPRRTPSGHRDDPRLTYALVTPARNERENLPRLAAVGPRPDDRARGLDRRRRPLRRRHLDSAAELAASTRSCAPSPGRARTAARCPRAAARAATCTPSASRHRRARRHRSTSSSRSTPTPSFDPDYFEQLLANFARRPPRHRRRRLLRARGRRVGPRLHRRKPPARRLARLPLGARRRHHARSSPAWAGTASTRSRPTCAATAPSSSRDLAFRHHRPRAAASATACAPARSRPRVVVHGLPPELPHPARAAPRPPRPAALAMVWGYFAEAAKRTPRCADPRGRRRHAGTPGAAVAPAPRPPRAHVSAAGLAARRRRHDRRARRARPRRRGRDLCGQAAGDRRAARALPRAAHARLTYDDGPGPALTPRAPGAAGQHDAHATFFPLGLRALAAGGPRRGRRGGHEVAATR